MRVRSVPQLLALTVRAASVCFVWCWVFGSACSMSQALPHNVAQAASRMHVLCLCLRRSRTLWVCLRFLKALFRDASKDIPMSHTRLVRRRSVAVKVRIIMLPTRRPPSYVNKSVLRVLLSRITKW